jgi:hypothetical protein
VKPAAVSCRGPAILGAALALALSPAIGAAGPPKGPTPEPRAGERQLLRVADAIPGFREALLVDHEEALAKYGTASARARFRELDRWLWYGLEARFGWAFFTNLSVVAFAPPDEHVNLVGFFNPWCDAVLVTAWQGSGTDQPQLFDAEVIAGEWLRDGAPLDEPRPAWMLKEGFRPLNAVRLSAETIASFETRFTPGHRADWRRSLSKLADPATRERTNYLSVAGRLIGTFSSVRDFVRARKGSDRRLDAVRAALSRLQEEGAAGRGGAVARSAKASLPGMEAAVAAIPPSAWKRLVAAAVVQANDGCLVLMVPRDGPGLVLSLFFRDDRAAPASLTRVDVLMVQAYLEQGRTPAAGRARSVP